MRRPHTSPQALMLLRALAARPQSWRHGYELMEETGLKSGTLYPLLMRLADDGLLESEWRPPVPPARAPRHAYRLTAKGSAFAHAAIRTADDAATSGPVGAVR